jgi:hypothetical protein
MAHIDIDSENSQKGDNPKQNEGSELRGEWHWIFCRLVLFHNFIFHLTFDIYLGLFVGCSPAGTASIVGSAQCTLRPWLEDGERQFLPPHMQGPLSLCSHSAPIT